VKESNLRLRWLLRVRGKRPPDSGAAERGNELPPSDVGRHSTLRGTVSEVLSLINRQVCDDFHSETEGKEGRGFFAV
jgi:hypothetical protein